MGFIIEFLFEAIAELFVAGYLKFFANLSVGFSPEKPVSAKAQKVLSICIGIVAMLIACATFIGIGLLAENEGHSVLGWHLTGAGVVYLVLGIGLNIYTKIKTKN